MLVAVTLGILGMHGLSGIPTGMTAHPSAASASRVLDTAGHANPSEFRCAVSRGDDSGDPACGCGGMTHDRCAATVPNAAAAVMPASGLRLTIAVAGSPDPGPAGPTRWGRARPEVLRI